MAELMLPSMKCRSCLLLGKKGIPPWQFTKRYLRHVLLQIWQIFYPFLLVKILFSGKIFAIILMERNDVSPNLYSLRIVFITIVISASHCMFLSKKIFLHLRRIWYANSLSIRIIVVLWQLIFYFRFKLDK